MISLPGSTFSLHDQITPKSLLDLFLEFYYLNGRLAATRRMYSG